MVKHEVIHILHDYMDLEHVHATMLSVRAGLGDDGKCEALLGALRSCGQQLMQTLQRGDQEVLRCLSMWYDGVSTSLVTRKHTSTHGACA